MSGNTLNLHFRDFEQRLRRLERFIPNGEYLRKLKEAGQEVLADNAVGS